MEESDELTSKTTGAVYAFRFKGFQFTESQIISTNISIEEKATIDELSIIVKNYIGEIEKFKPIYCVIKEFSESSGGSGIEKIARSIARKPMALIFKRNGDSVVNEHYDYFVNSRKLAMSFNNYSVSIIEI